MRTRSQSAQSRRSRPRRPLGGGAGANPRRVGLLVCARVAVHGASLDGLVDGALQAHVLGVGSCGVAALDGRLEVAEVGLDRGGVVAVLQTLALGAQDPLLL